jgi:hypothetical protein
MIQQVIQQSFLEPFLTGGLLLGVQPTFRRNRLVVLSFHASLQT